MKFCKLLSFIFIAAVIISLQSCKSQPLPENRPTDMQIIYSEDGGMLDKGKTVFISGDSSYVMFRSNGAENKIYMIFRKAQLDSLYGIFKKNDFPGINVYQEEEVYDRGGTSIILKWGKERITKLNTGMSFVTEGSQAEYTNIKDAINSMAESFLKQMERNFAVELDSSITSTGDYVTINMDDEWNYSSSESGMKDTLALKVLDGQHSFSVVISKTEPGTNRRKIVSSENFKVDIKPEISALRFYLENGKIIMKELNTL